MEKYARFKYQPCLPLGSDGRRVTASKAHIALSRRAAAEGAVLLKNENNALPFKKGERIALFGKATIEYIKGGGGSGDVNCPHVTNIYEGFCEKEAEGKVEIYPELISFYKYYVEAAQKNVPTDEQINKTWDKVNAMPFCQERDDITYDTFFSMHVPEAEVPDEFIAGAAGFADTAIFTVSRFSAEGTDRRAVRGDYCLSELEEELLTKLRASFKKVIVVLNTGAIIDCEFFEGNNAPDAVLLAWQGGMEGGAAVADLLCGDCTPCGKLPDTVAKSYHFYPSSGDFNESFDYLNYTEDIYVGYRYFETVPGARELVRYPFGFGLSYTTFEITGAVAGEANGRINAAFTVTNTGTCSGRETVQLYFKAPGVRLDRPARQLAAFAKTPLLKPGESVTLAVGFPVSDMAAFDDLGKISGSSLVLENGNYSFYLGTSVRDAEKLDFEYTVDEDTVTAVLNKYCRPFKLEKRMLSDGGYEYLPMGEENYYYGKNAEVNAAAPETPVKFDRVGEEISLDDFVRQFTVDELTDFVGGHAPTGVANTGCFGGLKRLGVPAVPTADGPAGLRLDKGTGIPTTAWPCATALAAAFDPELAYEVGAAAAAEIRENNLGVWLAPALNIHRDPLCGRNFEYFSEDPLLAGKSAAAEIRGIQSQKVAVSMKHFACNNKEANRFGCDSRVSERALREIYLKCFEICVKDADPWSVMSSYNLINGCHTSESYELLTGILRSEWGFKGMVTTDWGVKNDPVKEVKAGNDMKMHCGYPEDLKAGLEDGRITRADLELCVRRILEMFTKLAGEDNYAS